MGKHLKHRASSSPLLACLALVHLNISLALTEEKTPVTIITKDPIGIKTAGDFYPLRIRMPDFEGKFGPPDKSEEDDLGIGYLEDTISHRYTPYGLSVLENLETFIIGYTFDVPPAKSPSLVKVDTGLTADTSIPDIIKIYGDPFKKDEDPGRSEVELYYKYQDFYVLTFVFDHGSLREISLNSNYLHFLTE